jgi:hypothetical protein
MTTNNNLLVQILLCKNPIPIIVFSSPQGPSFKKLETALQYFIQLTNYSFHNWSLSWCKTRPLHVRWKRYCVIICLFEKIELITLFCVWIIFKRQGICSWKCLLLWPSFFNLDILVPSTFYSIKITTFSIRYILVNLKCDTTWSLPHFIVLRCLIEMKGR